MALFRRDVYRSNGLRLTGFPRYMEVLENNLKKFMITNLITLLGFLPFAAGVLYSVLSSSVLLLLVSCILGGCIAGPCLACMHDAVFRGLREAPGKFLENYKRAWKQNWKQSVLPGIVFCLLVGFYIFMLMLFTWATRFPGWGTIALYLFGLLIFTMIFTIYWPMVALLSLSGRDRILNSILFIMTYFWKMLGLSLLQLAYWIIIGLILPWSVFLLPLTGFWFILFTTDFFLYDTINVNFHIEEEIQKNFPEQAPFYEDDDTWIKRKQAEALMEKDHK